MSADKNNAALATSEDDILSAISAFEKIVEVMPNDRNSLAILSQAYMQIGDLTRAFDYLIRWGEEVLRSTDAGDAADVMDRLSAFKDDQRASDLVRRLALRMEGTVKAVALPPQAEVASMAQKPVASAEELNVFRISEELSLAWNLMEADELTQDEYASVVQDLSEMSASADHLSVSVLHVLESRGFKQFDRILSSLSRDCATPFVSLSSYEFQFGIMARLPLDFCVHRGALAFERIGDELLVAVLNPQNKSVRRDVLAVTGCRCHFFLALPSEFDQAVGRYRETLAHGAQLEA